MTARRAEYHIEGTTPITEFREIDEVLRSNAFVQAAYADAVQPLVHDTLTVIDGSRHAMRTRLENKLFTRDAIAYYKQEAVEPLLREELAELRRQREAEGVVQADLAPLIWRIARRVPAFVVASTSATACHGDIGSEFARHLYESGQSADAGSASA